MNCLHLVLSGHFVFLIYWVLPDFVIVHGQGRGVDQSLDGSLQPGHQVGCGEPVVEGVEGLLGSQVVHHPEHGVRPSLDAGDVHSELSGQLVLGPPPGEGVEGKELPGSLDGVLQLAWGSIDEDSYGDPLDELDTWFGPVGVLLLSGFAMS